MRNADASINARISFAENPENPYLQKLIDGVPATAVTWDIRGLKPNGMFEMRVRYFHSGSGLIPRDFGDLRIDMTSGSSLGNILRMDHIVICGSDSGWRHRTVSEGAAANTKGAPILFADGEGKAQGVSIERGLRVQDVLGRMIVILELENAKAGNIQKQRPALGVIGCQCLKNYQ